MKVQITEPFLPLVDESHPNYKSRYLTWYGGRGGMKTTSISDGLLIRGIRQTERILCGREFQNSISDSVHKTLADEIVRLGMQDHYEVQATGIFGKHNGTEFLFRGLKSNIQSLKSIAGITIFWNEEAQTTSQKSIDVIMPTIRAENSQIINSMNPDLEDDPAYQYFVVNPPPDSYVRKVNYTDNPFLPDTLRKEAEYCLKTDPDKYNHIWLGECQKLNEGTILGKWLVQAELDGRITTVPYNPAVPVITSWDLGYSDATVIWFCQLVGKEPRLIDFYQATGASLDHYVKILKDKDYNYSMHVLPHDAGHNSLRTGKTLAEQLQDMGLGRIGKTIEVLPIVGVEAGNELSRQLLTQLWIDKDKCSEGIKGLKKYRYEWDDERKIYKLKPIHDFASDIADSFRYLAMYLSTLKSSIVKKPEMSYSAFGNQSWMG